MHNVVRSGVLISLVLLCTVKRVHAADCNDNGVDDATDIASGFSQDCNTNGIPDECDLIPSLMFAAPVGHPVGATPFVLAAGELDNLAGLDLVTANNGERTVSVLLNNGNGTFQAAVPYPTDKAAFSVTIADFDGVHGFDLAAATKNNTVSVLLNNGNGTFASGGDFPTLGDRPTSIASGDLDGVNGPDLVVASRNADPLGNFLVSVLLNNGDGTFASAVTYFVQDTPRHVVIFDFDGLNGLDLAVANKQSDTVSVLLNNGDGTFAAAINAGAGNGPVSLAVADLDGDLDADLSVVDVGSDRVRVLLGNGDGTFSFGGEFPVGVGPESVAAEDFDGDGHVDLVVANHGTLTLPGSTMSVLLNRGDGTFRGHIEFPTGSSPISIVAGDLNSDGLPDAATAHDLIAGNVSVVLLGSIDQFSQDCNGNGKPDECDIVLGPANQALRMSAPVTAVAGGTVFLSGDDADDFGHCQGTSCGGLYPAIFTFAISHSTSPGTGIIAIGVNASSALTALNSWNDPLNGGPGVAVTILNDPVMIASVVFTDFAALYIPSAEFQTPGGITTVQLDALNARQADVVNFVNVSGGALIALTEAGAANAYGWLPFPIEFANQQHINVCPTTALTDTLAPSATCANMSHGFYHTIFTGPPGFLGMSVLALSTDAPVDQVVLLGGVNVVIGGRISLTPNSVNGPICAQHTVTATVTDGVFPFGPLVGQLVTFTITVGPNAGKNGASFSDLNGLASFSYRGEGGPGTDEIQASFEDSAGLHVSNIVTAAWAMTSQDCNGNGVPDECELLTPGDMNGDGVVDLMDYPAFFACLTSPCTVSTCTPALFVCIPCCSIADFDQDGDVDIIDVARFEALFGMPIRR